MRLRGAFTAMRIFCVLGILVGILSAQDTTSPGHYTPSQLAIINKLKNGTYSITPPGEKSAHAVTLKDGEFDRGLSDGVPAGRDWLDVDSVMFIKLESLSNNSGVAAVFLEDNGGNYTWNYLCIFNIKNGNPIFRASVCISPLRGREISFGKDILVVKGFAQGPEDSGGGDWTLSYLNRYKLNKNQLILLPTGVQVDQLCQDLIDSVRQVEAIQYTMATNPDAVYAYQQLNESLEDAKKKKASKLKEAKEYGLLVDPQFRQKIAAEADRMHSIGDRFNLAQFQELSPSDQTAVLVANGVALALNRILGR